MAENGRSHGALSPINAPTEQGDYRAAVTRGR